MPPRYLVDVVVNFLTETRDECKSILGRVFLVNFRLSIESRCLRARSFPSFPTAHYRFLSAGTRVFSAEVTANDAFFSGLIKPETLRAPFPHAGLINDLIHFGALSFSPLFLLIKSRSATISPWNLDSPCRLAKIPGLIVGLKKIPRGWTSGIKLARNSRHLQLMNFARGLRLTPVSGWLIEGWTGVFARYNSVCNTVRPVETPNWMEQMTFLFRYPW